jgi:hypothetical protein
MTTLLPELFLGFPLICEGAWRRVHPMPFKKEWRRPWMSPRRCRPSDKDFSRPPKNHDPDAPSRSTKLAAHQLAPP